MSTERSSFNAWPHVCLKGLFSSSGTLHYSTEGVNLRVEVDPEIVRYYRSLIPRSIKTNPQAYSPHISVVRKEIVPNMTAWRKYEGKEIVFFYSNIICFGDVYVWLNVFCSELEDIREELGLSRSSEITRPPTGWDWTFHTTIGNFKGT